MKCAKLCNSKTPVQPYRAILPKRTRNTVKQQTSQSRLAVPLHINVAQSRGFVQTSKYVCAPRLGQPHHETHPHLFKSKDEITPGITAEEYARRRKNFLQIVPGSTTCVLIPANPEYYMTNDIPFVYHQYTNLLFLTGFQEPGAVAVIEKLSDEGDHIFRLFVRPRDPSRELWDGPRCGVDNAKLFGAHVSYPIAEFSNIIPDIIKNYSTVWFPQSVNPEITAKLKAIPGVKDFKDPTNLLSLMRLVKSPIEINLMHRAGVVAAESMVEAMKYTRPNMTEHELGAKMEFEVKKRGGQRMSYPPVVAGGDNALTLHYITNDMVLKDGDLVLMDAGAEVDGYASDITRTWPVNGKYTEPQRQIYDAVLACNKLCIELCKTASKNPLSLHLLQRESTLIIQRELAKLGIPSTPEAVNRFYPHSIGHYLGMDIHDVHELPGNLQLLPGTIITIEPGIYIPYDDSVPKRFQGIGVRIEDDVVITEGGAEVLTKDVPKDAEVIESIMRGSSKL